MTKKLVLVWKVKISHVGILVWASLSEARVDFKEWRSQGHWAYFWPSIMTRNKFENTKEFRGP